MVISETQLKNYFQKAKIEISTSQLKSLTAFIALLQKFNKVHNLTAICSAEEIIVKHIIDSAILVNYLQGDVILDVGSGGGCPGIVLAIFCPKYQFTLVEKVEKKALFLEHVIFELNLTNVRVENKLVENLTGSFTTIVARAFSSTAKLLTLTAKLQVKGTKIINMQATSEINSGVETIAYALPILGHPRSLEITYC